MGKTNHMNPTGQTGSVPLDGPGSAYAASRFPGTGFDTGNVDGPNEQCRTTPEPYAAPVEPAVDGPNNKTDNDARGRDANPTY